MKDTRAARRYAKALLDLVVERKKESSLENDMTTVVEVIQSNDEVRDFFQNNIISSEEKERFFKSVFKDVSEETLNLVRLLISNNRIELIEDVAIETLKQSNAKNGKKEAIVTTATPLSKNLEEVVLAKAKELSSGEIVIKNEVNPSVLGGFILRIEDLEYNASVLKQINALKEDLVN